MQTDSQNHFLKQLSNKELLSQTKSLVQKERNLHIRILHHLREINSRKLYFEMGFSSLFDYTVRELGYSEGAAYRRIKAMKLCQDLPETENQLQSGKLSLSAASQLQVFFEKQDRKAKEKLDANKTVEDKEEERKGSENKKIRDEKRKSSGIEQKNNGENFKPFSLLEKQKLIDKVEGCSTRQTMKLLSEADPSFSPHKEQVRFLGKGKVEIKMVINEDCHKKLEELKHLLSHKNPSLSYGELLSILSDEALRKQDPRKKKVRQNRVKTSIDLKEKQGRKKELVGRLDAPSRPVALKKEEVTSAPKLAAPEEGKRIVLGQNIEGKEVPFREKTPLQELVTLIKKKRHKKLTSRAIPSYLRKYIWERDGGQCTYVNHKTKQRCSSRHLLQIDHIQPFSLNGRTEAGNLRLLCAGHNRFRSGEVSNGK